jgi:hypothetical protein
VAVLVTGTGRTGTWWLTEALRLAGVKAEHEIHYSLDKQGPIPDGTVEVSWLAAPFTPVDVWTIHLVRHPLKTIASRAAWGSFGGPQPRYSYNPRPKGDYAIRHCPKIAEGTSPVERAAIHWVEWNRLVQADEVLRLEDVTAETVRDIARRVGDAKLPRLPKPTNQAPNPPKLVWADVEHVDGLTEMAGRFGYL